MELFEHQKAHVEKIWNLLVKDQVFSFIDTSQTGLGKTITSLWIAKKLQEKYGTQVMLVAPSDTSLNNLDGWNHHAKNFGIEVLIKTTYSSLRGGQGKVSHPWLIPDPNDKKNWIASKAFEKVCSQGLFIIFDEFHHAKNLSMAHFSCAALVKMAKKYRKVCRVGLLSHTPGDKEEHIPQILRMSGIITYKELFRHIPFTREYEIEGYGLGELQKVCKKVVGKDKVKKREIEEKFGNISKKRSFVICKELYNEHIRSIITFAMPKPEEQNKVTFLNAFLETDPESLKIVQDGINLLSNAVAWNELNQQVGDANQWNLGNIGASLKLIERGKLLAIAKYVLKEIKKHPHKKFVISCGARGIEHQDILRKIIYRESNKSDYEDIFTELRDKNPNWKRLPKDMINYIGDLVEEKVSPDVINGKTSKKERVDILRKFQENSSKSWCLIISPGTGSESLSLHDRHGGKDREMLIVPDYFFSRLVQNTGRVVRVGMKSDVKVLIVYSKGASLETSILNSMVKKSKTAKDLLSEDQEVLFPAEYPYWIEGKKDLDLENKLNILKNSI